MSQKGVALYVCLWLRAGGDVSLMFGEVWFGGERVRGQVPEMSLRRYWKRLLNEG